jgi:hypothetical protein
MLTTAINNAVAVASLHRGESTTFQRSARNAPVTA